jgi:hypothetical protein
VLYFFGNDFLLLKLEFEILVWLRTFVLLIRGNIGLVSAVFLTDFDEIIVSLDLLLRETISFSATI